MNKFDLQKKMKKFITETKYRFDLIKMLTKIDLSKFELYVKSVFLSNNFISSSP